MGATNFTLQVVCTSKLMAKHLKKQEKSQINNLTLHLKQLEKEEMFFFFF